MSARTEQGAGREGRDEAAEKIAQGYTATEQHMDSMHDKGCKAGGAKGVLALARVGLGPNRPVDVDH